MHGRAGEKKEPWLLIKSKDDEARNPGDPDILEDQPLSVVSGRSIPEIAEGKGRKRVWHSNRSVKDNVTGAATKGHGVLHARRRAQDFAKSGARPAIPGDEEEDSQEARRQEQATTEPRPRDAPLPDFVPPSLATLRSTAPSSPGWAHEIKFDGYRIQARLDRRNVRLLTRKGLDWTGKFPNVAAAVAELPARTALIDGEVVIVDEDGASSFSALQAALKAGERERFLYYVFDLLHLDGRDLTGLPLIERKAELKRLARQVAAMARSDTATTSRNPDRRCCSTPAGWASKESYPSARMRRIAPAAPRRSSRPNARTPRNWWSAAMRPRTLPRAIGALVVGYYDQGRFIYAGRVGTGYTHTVARDLWKRLHPLEIDKPPFDQIPRDEARRRDVHWVEPRTVIESELRGWTADGLVRQAAFKGVREDKSPREVVRELPARAQCAGERRNRAENCSRGGKDDDEDLEDEDRATASPAKSGIADVRFTHPDRVYWADVGVTKQDLADYYRAVWDWMAPHIVDRPLALVRCPDGTTGQCFFQKHASAGLTEKNLRTVIDSKKRQIIAVEDLNGLLSLVQAGVLEVHVRGSTIDHLERL